ncbi:MAG: PAS domain-containing protein [Desulfomonile tiedjei]|nr:PAS domain-containing protein [Desulfomonile tiedjei]
MTDTTPERQETAGGRRSNEPPETQGASLRILLDQLPDVVFSLDCAGRFMFVNAKAEESLGREIGEILGTRLSDYAVSGDRPLARSLLKAGQGTVWDRELDIRAANGVQKHVRIRCVATFDRGGEKTGYAGVMRDRTAQRKLEEEVKKYQQSLKESEERHRRLVEELPDVLFQLDFAGRFTYLNSRAAELLGYPVSQMLMTSLREYAAPEYRTLADSVIRAEPGSVWDEQMALVDAKEERRWVRIRCKACLDRQGRMVGFEGTIRDRTATKRLEEDLMASKQEIMDKIKIIDDLYEHIVQSEKAKAIASHTAEVAHELRQPLAIIGGFARRMVKQLGACHKLDPEQQRECFGVILKEVERLERILGGLVDFTSQRPVSLQSIDPTDVIEKVLLLYEELFREKDLRLEIDFGAEVTDACIDPDRFEQIVRNLVTYAVDVSPRRGVVRIETKAFQPSGKVQAAGGLKASAYFEMKIHHHGHAILPEDLQKIFDPFSTTKDYGAGIGLTISKKMAEEQNGSLSVKSDETGTVFCVWIPLRPVGVSCPASLPETGAAKSAAGQDT